MAYNLTEMDCVELAYAGHIITDYSNVLQKKLLDMSSGKYKEHVDIIEAHEMQLESVIDARKGLLKVANRCGCSIDVKTGMLG